VTGRRAFLKRTALAGGGLAAGTAGLNWLGPRIWSEPLVLEPNRSHWALSQPSANPPLARDIDADVAIVGGGFTGLSTAYYLRRNPGVGRVVVLEARGCGNGASGRNGGMVLTMTADRFMRFGADPALDKRIYDLTVDNIRRLRALGTEVGVDCELETGGALQVFGSRADQDAGRAYVEKARGLGMPVEYWDRQRTAAALGTSAYAGAFFDPGCGQVHPMKLVRLLKTAAETAGAEICENTKVTAIEEGDVVRVHTANGPAVRARALVLAANAYSSKLGYFRNAIVPVFNHVGITSALDAATLGRVGWNCRLPFSDNRTLVTYLGLTPDNRIHIGGGSAEYFFGDGLQDRTQAGSVERRLQAELSRIFPALAEAGVGIAGVWSGVVDCSLDFSPSVGRLGENVYYGIGYSGHGVNLTSLFGRIIADVHAGQEARWRDLPFLNRALPYIPNEPLRWLGARAALAAFAL